MARASRKGLILYTFRRNKTSIVGVAMAVVIVCLAILAPWISPYDPIEQNVKMQYSVPSFAHICGTDGYGRDEFSRILCGSRVSLVVGIASVLFSMVFGNAESLIFLKQKGLNNLSTFIY